jgi:16S rRNA (cytosine1402-N4)-methyltransferase
MEHYPVMCREVMEFLGVRQECNYIDATCGLGGHTGAIAAKLTTGKVIANDRDASSIAKAKANTLELADRIRFRYGSFSSLSDLPDEELKDLGVRKADGLVADLGISRYQLTTGDRGFSIMADGPLDMRMDRSQELTADRLINESAEKALADWIYQFGEERRARTLARAIVRARPIRSTQHLADVVERAVPRTGPMHPATRAFQAIRIVTNDEMGELEKLLEAAPALVKSGGRIVIISFHSLEDRKVKERFRELAKEGRGLILTKRPLQPDDNEVKVNPASRSAKLRALEVVHAA